MAENIIIRQNSRFETEFLATDLDDPDDGGFSSISHIHAITPYSMLMAGLGACTAIILNSYARNHGLALRDVDVRLQYSRNFKEDCKNCEDNEKYEEQIEMEIVLNGELTPDERQKLFSISRQCPIHKILKSGIMVQSKLA